MIAKGELPYLTASSPSSFLRVGLCSHTVSLLQVTWRHNERRVEAETLDRVDRSPRDQQLRHVSEIKLSGCDRRLTCCHMALFGAWIFLERTMIAARVDRAIEAVQPT